MSDPRPPSAAAPPADESPAAAEPAKPPEPGGERDLVARQKEFFETFFKRGVQFTEELLTENERLRYRVLRLEEELSAVHTGSTDPQVRALAQRIAELERERDTLVNRFQKVEEQNRAFQERYSQIEREHNNLANLYVASYQLHSTLDLREIVQIVIEILLNFVGAQTFALYVLDEETRTLRPLASEGAPLDAFPPVRSGEGVLGEVIASGRIHVGEDITGREWDPSRPVIAMPLGMGNRTVGGIAIHRLLVQKTELLDVDYELFKLLSCHAAGALVAARVAAELGQRPLAYADFRRLLR